MIELDKVHQGTGGLHGFLPSVAVDGANVYAAGGTYHKPTLLYSNDHGRSFTTWPAPSTPGLRSVLVDGDRIWVVGEYGMVATTVDQGKTWERITVPSGPICLYQIARDAKGALWIVGDNGLVLRRPKKKFVRVENQSKGRMLRIVFDARDGKPWLLDDPGNLQRWDGKRFVRVKVNGSENRILTSIVRTRTGALILVGDKGLLLRSANDGKKWTQPKIAGVPLTDAVEDIHITRYGILAVGGRGLFLVSHDDGQSWRKIKTGTKIGLWSFADVEGGLMIGADDGVVFRAETAELAKLLRDAYKKQDSVIAGLASSVIAGEVGAEMVLDDALRERDLWG